MKKILVIGANGFLGLNLLNHQLIKQKKNDDYYIVSADLENSNIPDNISYYYIDITNFDDTLKKIMEISPDIIILTAAMTNVDECEKHKELSTKLNFEGANNILKICEKLECKLIFLSTDFIFDGTKKNGNYTENDIPNPLNHYGKTKHRAEQAIINSDIEFLICRTATLYGWNPNKLNFITWVLDKLQKNEKIRIVTNQINNATFVRNLAEILLKLIEKNANGIYHTAGDGALSRFEMAILCAEIFNYNKELIIPIDKLDQIAVRPKNAGLDISKLKKFLASDLKIFSLEDGLKHMREFRN